MPSAALALAQDFQAPNPRAVVGGNNPPLDQVLAEDSADLVARAKALAESAGRAVVTDDDTAGKATLLAKMIKEHIAAVDAKREETKAPYLQAGRTVDAHFHGIAGTLATYTKVGTKEKLTGGPLYTVMEMIDGYRIKKEAAAEAERKRLEAEANAAREAAVLAAQAQREAEERERKAAEESARRIAEAEAAAKAAGDREAQIRLAAERAEADLAEVAARERKLQAEIEERRQTEEADRLARLAAETHAAPIDSGLGAKASSRKVWTVEITDLTAAIKHARKVDEASVRAAVQTIYDRQVKAGVRDLPGATVRESSQTIIR